MNRLATLAGFMSLILLPGPASADEDVNKIAFNNHCRNCHSFKKDDNRLGPSMHGVYGAKSGQVRGFRNYSGTLTDIVWDETMLDRFIADPASISAGTNMIYPRVGDPVERAKIIAFLKSISEP